MTDKITVPSEKDLSSYKAQATRHKNRMDEFTIANDDDYAKAGDAIVVLKKYQKEVADKKNSILKPINEAAKNTRALFKPVEDQLAASRSTVEGKMLAYRKQKQEEAAKAEAELKEKVESGEVSQDQAVTEMEQAVEPDKTVQGDKGKTTVRITRDVEIVNESAIPRAYLVPDMVKIRAAALGKGGHPQVDIPGVKVVEKESIV